MRYKILTYAFFTLFAICILHISASAQSLQKNPVRWVLSTEMTTPTEGTVTLKATTSTGWHLYGTDLPEGGPIATQFTVTESDGITFTDDFTPNVEPVTKHDSAFDMDLSWWSGSVSFTRHFTVDENAVNPSVNICVRYMACNDMNCSPPQTLNLKIDITNTSDK